MPDAPITSNASTGSARSCPTHFDLVVNTDAVSVEQAAELISMAALQ